MITALLLIRSTFFSLIRQRILYNVLFIAVFLLLAGYLASLLVFGHQDRVMLHFGMMINSLSLFFIAASGGARVVRMEIEDRSLQVVLSKPIARPLYYFSKWAGLNLFLAFNLVLLSVALFGGLFWVEAPFHSAFLSSFFQMVCLVGVECWVISSFALLISLWLPPAVAVMSVLAYGFIGHSHETISYLHEQGQAGFLNTIRFLFPRFDRFLLDTRVYYEMTLTAEAFFSRVGYGALWAVFFLLIGNMVFYRKNL